jgi:hypothetical protein
MGETPLSKYETAAAPSQKIQGQEIEAPFWLSENPIGACLAPMVVLAH